ncbi:MAG: peptidoglycan bridge formation glycyltransferase FemA/FemB family protein, partial [Candidatus Omnitrophica bacterium]|nr:peptidoglycan bridge formation glycyltransferase FemA/FemB family protein [Candidatus Omnitrophota bacterium]
MLRERLASDKDFEAWEAFNLNSPEAHIFQSFYWMAVMRSLGWESFPYMVEESCKILAIASVFKKTKFNFSFLYVPRGPVMDCSRKELVILVLGFLKRITRENRSIRIKLNPDISGTENLRNYLDSLKGCGFTEARDLALHTDTFRVSLKEDEETIFARMRKGTRYDIRHAEKEGVVVSRSADSKSLDVFCRLHRAMSRNKNIGRVDPDFFKKVFECLAPKGYAHVFIARYNNEPKAAAFILGYGGTAYFMWGATDVSCGTLSPAKLMHWEIIRWAKNRNFAVYDLQGV